jgi:polysaccharide biosynthesis/export protein
MRVLLLAAGTILLSCIQVFPGEQPTPTPVPAQETSPDYVIGLEDVLAVNVWKEPELSLKEVAVRPDGKISIPLIGDVEASGITPQQLQERIVDRMKEYITSPNVTVVVVKIASRSVSVVGKVARPGLYYLGAPMTVLELLARTGGLVENAKGKAISIVRKEGGKNVSFKFDFKEVSKGKNLQQNIPLKSGDVIIVP